MSSTLDLMFDILKAHLTEILLYSILRGSIEILVYLPEVHLLGC